MFYRTMDNRRSTSCFSKKIKIKVRYESDQMKWRRGESHLDIGVTPRPGSSAIPVE